MRKLTKLEKILLMIVLLSSLLYIGIYQYETTQIYYLENNLKETEYSLKETIQYNSDLANFYSKNSRESKQTLFLFTRSIYWINLAQVIDFDISMDISNISLATESKWLFLKPFNLAKLSIQNKITRIKINALQYNLMLINANLDKIANDIKYPNRKQDPSIIIPKEKKIKNSIFKTSPFRGVFVI